MAVPDITSRQHPIVKAFKDAARGDDSVALIDGWHLLSEALDARCRLDVVAIAGDLSDTRRLPRLPSTTRVLSVSSAVMNAMSPVRTPTGVVAIVRRRHHTPASLWSATSPFIVVAVDVQDPGNVGGLIRSAEAGGATGVLVAGASADAWGWKALRAGMGSTFRLPIVQQPDAVAACEALRSAGLRLLGTVPHGGVSMEVANLRGATAILLGGEGAGLDPALLALAHERLSIPMAQGVDSLNVAVAAGVLVYEARRQRLATASSR